MPIPSDWAQNLRNFEENWAKYSQDGVRRTDDSEYLGDAPFKHFVLTEKAETWDGLLDWVKELGEQWCFRGQRNASWKLDTSLDRAVFREYSSENGWGSYHLNRQKVIDEVLFRFQQQAHQYVPKLPSRDDLGSWLALMQHYGVPTEFLDWTKSPYVALYFAFEEKPPKEVGCALWAIDLDWLEQKWRVLLSEEVRTPGERWKFLGPKERASYLSSLLGKSSASVIVSIDPLQLDARMVAQSGFFLCKLFHQATFSQILMTMMIHPKTSDGPDLPDRPVVRKLAMPSELRIEFLRRLRKMNIHRASLFPGLDGFGKSLWFDVELDDG